jgi:hypothetical protein
MGGLLVWTTTLVILQSSTDPTQTWRSGSPSSRGHAEASMNEWQYDYTPRTL